MVAASADMALCLAGRRCRDLFLDDAAVAELTAVRKCSPLGQSEPSSPAGSEALGAMPTGLLLAAGEGRRFGADKRLQLLPDGTPMVVASARTLRSALSQVLVVVREPGVVADRLAAEGFDLVICPAAGAGMGHSIACGVAASRAADGWLIALGDMPWVSPQSIAAVAAALNAGAAVARPVYAGVAGHPVAFSGIFAAALLGLKGDRGARDLLCQLPVTQVRCADPGVLRDVDRPEDLRPT